MRRKLSVLVRSGLVALAATFALPVVAEASPAALGRMPAASLSDTSAPLIDVRHRDWRGDRWRDDWRWRHRPHRRNHWGRWGGSGIYFSFGIPAYRYYQPRYYQPRRIYRSGGMSPAHIRWCYDRYRSYRAWDNSFQPYNGPRRQCWSPYG